ncbi:F-box/LRR-repeat protein [Trifolium repens]|nr:F-box/LRR-repeat protein [Trifolium repens]
MDDNDDDNNNCHYLNSLSLVSKQFLSITNRLLFSSRILQSTDLNGFFKRFTNLNSLNIKRNNLDTLLIQISCFPLKLTSLNISCKYTIPANGLRAFSQKITTLTSLTCSHIRSLNTSDLLLIAECFPMLEQLDLRNPSDCKNYTNYVDGVEALSLALIKLRKVNLTRFPINNQSLFHLFNNCKYLEEVIILKCDEITSEGLASALRERPTLTSLSFSITPSNPVVFTTSHFIDSLVSLKGLTSLVLHGLLISDDLLYSIERESLPLIRLDLRYCVNYSYSGIYWMLSKCQRIKYLDLRNAYFLKDHHVVKLSSFLQDLVSINLGGCPNLTKSALFTLTKNCPSLSVIKMERIGSKSVQKSEFGEYLQLKSLYLGENSWLSDESIIMFASVFPNLELLDLKYCNHISKGICQVLRKCRKIRHLNLAGCSRVKLLGISFAVPNLEVLNLSYTNVDDKTLYVISKSCCGLLKLLLECCNGITEKGVKHVVENCTKLRKIMVPYSLSDKNRKLFSRHGCQILYC